MNNPEILNTELLRDRVLKMEYDDLTEEDIRRILLEETGKEQPKNITIYKSDDFVGEDNENGFNGTAIHFYDKKQNVNQLYTITRGTEMVEKKDWRPTDWTYNLMGVFLGENTDQYRTAKDFEQNITEKIQNDLKEKGDKSKLQKIGLGHSLGGNLITLLQLTGDNFDTVYTVNPAPPSAYQLAKIDIDFRYALNLKFGLRVNNFEDIYTINPQELEKFAEDYYKEAGTNIEHITTKQDILQSAFSLRGFFRVGNYTKPIDVYPGEDVESLAKLFEKLPDSFVKKVKFFGGEPIGCLQ